MLGVYYYYVSLFADKETGSERFKDWLESKQVVSGRGQGSSPTVNACLGALWAQGT